MKKIFFPFLLLALVASTGRAQILVGDMNGDGILNVSDITSLVSAILGNASPQYISGSDIIVESRDYVDLDLPSGTLWATCNLGASCPEGYVDRYYAWGETAIHPDKSYRWNNYKYSNGDIVGDRWVGITKYCNDSSYGLNGYTDQLTELEAVDDVATAKWGEDWKTPTLEQAMELSSECTWTWTTLNNVEGYRVKSKKSERSIFLPACGCRWSEWLEGPGISGYHGGCYWTSTLYTNSPTNAWYIHAYKDRGGEISHQARSYGFQIRPVRARK